jgi:hypothetical protein
MHRLEAGEQCARACWLLGCVLNLRADGINRLELEAVFLALEDFGRNWMY